jgi:hypothetical protein
MRFLATDLRYIASSWNVETEERPQILIPKDERASSLLETTNGPLVAAEDNDQIPGDGSTASSTALNTALVMTESSANPGYIKVLSRTIIVDGTFSESQLHSLFVRFGRVQTFTNYMNSWAIVKMRSHHHAINALAGIESCRLRGILSIQWYSAFGRPHYMDISTGVSNIPIGDLGRIERGWLLTAKHGGTRGLPIHSGMVIEAPDTDLFGISKPPIVRFMSGDTDLNLRRDLDPLDLGIPGQYPARDFFGCFRRDSRSIR